MRVPESAIGNWFEAHLQRLSLGEGAEGYLYGRGAREELIQRLGVGEWSPAPVPCPSGDFTRRYGPYGERLKGYLAFPLRAPTGRLVGVEFRAWWEKKIAEYRVPEAAWNPVLINAPCATERMAGGGSVWVVEGVYDLFALEWAVPPGDVVLSTLRAGLARTTVEYLARWCRNRVYMVYDNDATGRRATNGWIDSTTNKRRPGAMELLRKAGLSAIDYRYRGKDPGDVWKVGGAVAVRAEFGRAVGL